MKIVKTKVRQKLKKISAGMDECYKMFEEGENVNASIQKEGMSHLLEEVNGKIKDLDFITLTSPGCCDKSKCLLTISECSAMTKKLSEVETRLPVKTFEVGVQVDLCGCSINKSNCYWNICGESSSENDARLCLNNFSNKVTNLSTSNLSSLEGVLKTINKTPTSMREEVINELSESFEMLLQPSSDRREVIFHKDKNIFGQFEGTATSAEADKSNNHQIMLLSDGNSSFASLDTNQFEGTATSAEAQKSTNHQIMLLSDGDSSFASLDAALDNFPGCHKDPGVCANGVTTQLKKKVGELMRRGSELRNFIINPTTQSTSAELTGLTQMTEKKVIGGVEKDSSIDSGGQHYSFLKSLSPDAEKHLMHPDSIRFISKFHSLKCELGQLLFEMFNTQVFCGKLTLNEPLIWNPRLTKTAGYCIHKYNSSMRRSFRIELSTKVCDSPDRLRDTLIHEMCHAYVWVEYGERDAHGTSFRLWARKANIILKELPPVTRCHYYVIHTKYNYRCLQCPFETGRHSRMKNVASKRCPRCNGTIQLVQS